MGLGKTLQSIALIWTLINQHPYTLRKPFLQKVIIITPLSLVRNWEKEIEKWLTREKLNPLVAMGQKSKVEKITQSFVDGVSPILLISYESFRNYAIKLRRCDLIIFDEGHRLKNKNIKTVQIFTTFPCKKRIILSGTPL